MPRPRLDHVRKAQILAAAAAVMSERGYANTRVADIARVAGTSPAAILYWFDGKDGLLAEALRLREAEFHERFTVHATRQPTASGKLRLVVEAMLSHYDWGLWMELSVRALRDDAAAAERDRLDRRWRAMLRSIIREGQTTGEFVPGDADDVMLLLAGLLDGWAPLLAVKANGITRERIERMWLAEASRLLGPGFDAAPLEPFRPPE